MIEDVPFSQIADLEASGVTVAGVKVRCVADAVPEVEDGTSAEDLADMVFPYEVGKTGPVELGDMGVGIGLYFSCLLWGFRIFALIAALSSFTIVVYLKSGFNSESMSAGGVSGYAVPTLGAVQWLHEQSIGIFSSAASSTDDTVMLALTCAECALACYFVFRVFRLTRDQAKTALSIDVSNITLQDYSIKVDGLPRDDPDVTPTKLGVHFSQFGRVHQVVLGMDVGSIIGIDRARAKLVRRVETLNAKLARDAAETKRRFEEFRAMEKERFDREKAKKYRPGVLVRLWRWHKRRVAHGTVGAVKNMKRNVARLESKIAKYAKRVAEKKKSITHHTVAFVTFETEESMQKAVRKYRPGNPLAWLFRAEKYRYKDHRLVVRRGPEPSTVLWENLQIVGGRAFRKRFTAWVGVVFVLICTGSLVVISQSRENKVPSSIDCDKAESQGLLMCDTMFPAAAASGEASKAIIRRQNGYLEQVTPKQCIADGYIKDGTWVGATSVYSPYPDSAEWDATTLKDECAALACMDCFCKERVSESLWIFLGIKSDDDGWYELCEDYLAARGYEQLTAAVTSITNILLTKSMGTFSEYESYHTDSDLQNAIAYKLFLSLVVNSALIPIIVYASVTELAYVPYLLQGEYTDTTFSWYDNVGALISSTMVTNAIAYPLEQIILGKFWLWRRRRRQKHAATQDDLNDLHENLEFPFAEKYAQATSMMFIAMMFSSSMPMLVPVLSVYFLLAFYEARYNLLRLCKARSPHTGPHTTAFARCTPILEDFRVPRAFLSAHHPSLSILTRLDAFSTPPDAFQFHPDVASRGTTLRNRRGTTRRWRTRSPRPRRGRPSRSSSSPGGCSRTRRCRSSITRSRRRTRSCRRSAPPPGRRLTSTRV
jgi:hypothetical protein